MANLRKQADMTEPTCGVGDCTRPVKVLARRMCSMHHTRWLRVGDTGEPTSRRQASKGRMCGTRGCQAPASRRSLCRKHYRVALLAERKHCSIEGCDKPWELGDLCGMHHYRKQQLGDPGAAEPLVRWYSGEPCEVSGCPRLAQSLGQCNLHRNYTRLTGKPATVFVSCMTCRATIDLRAGKNGRFLANRPRMCAACLLLRPRGRWCMTTQEIADRDGASCKLCLQVVDLDIRWPDPFSPSVDHILPRSRGGQDVPENVALAHLRCNVMKGVSTGTA